MKKPPSDTPPKDQEECREESLTIPLTADEKSLILSAAMYDDEECVTWSREKLLVAAKSTLKKKMQSAPDAFEMFCFASLYQQGASDIQRSMIENNFVADESTAIVTRNNHVAGLVIPSSILLCLSFEVYLKCLCAARGQMTLVEHNTRKLFMALEKDDQSVIERRFAENAGSGLAFKKMELESVLRRTSSYFTKMRYGYEMPVPRMPKPKEDDVRGIYGLLSAVKAVRSVILDAHPDWQQRFLDRKSFF